MDADSAADREAADREAADREAADREPAIPAAAAAMHGRDRVREALGMRVGEVAAGRASVRLRVTGSMVNGHGIAHGGYVFLLADTAFAYACNSHGPVTVAHAAQITFLQPAREGDELRADAVERARYGRNGIYDVTVRRMDGPAGGPVVAEFRGQSTALPPPPDGS